MNKIGLLFLIFIILTQAVFAKDQTYFESHEKGWHWYETAETDDDDEEASLENDPIKQMNAVHAAVQRALDKAVLQPNKENLKNYITLQNQVMGKAREFNHNWQAVILENPELNFSLVHPTNNLAKQVESDQRKLREDSLLDRLSKTAELVFFYRSTCPYCQRFSPIVRDFSEHYHLLVNAITTDGVVLPEFPNSSNDQGQARALNVAAEPALFIFNKITHKAYPIAFGLTSEAEIKRNIKNVITHFEGDVHDQ